MRLKGVECARIIISYALPCLILFNYLSVLFDSSGINVHQLLGCEVGNVRARCIHICEAVSSFFDHRMWDVFACRR